MQPGQSLNDLVSAAIALLDECFTEKRPDMVVVQGDTTSAMCAGLVAFHRRIAVAHVEAGLRSGDRRQPFPEESNRKMIAAVSDLHFAPTENSAANLLREGVPAKDILVTGNTGIDALLAALGHTETMAAEHAEAGDSAYARSVLITLHRRETYLPASGGSNQQTPLWGILEGLAKVAHRWPDTEFVYPVHPNPSVRGPARILLSRIPNVRLLEPQPYLDFVRLMDRACLIVTDSGGVQEEAPSLGVPVLVVRNTTERPEGLACGSNVLVGTEADALAAALERGLAQPWTKPRPIPLRNPFGDGNASERILAGILHFFGLGPPPDPYCATQPLALTSLH
jgi:UDP-N-acetylglucosamine 2-epimerase (non-hydrolysing)